KAGNGLIQRYSNMDSVIAYNDPSAIGAVTAARGAGRKLTVIGLNGTSDGIAGVRSGQLAATVQGAPVDLGIQSVTAAYDLITNRPLPLAKVVVEPPRIVTKANVDKIKDWNSQIAFDQRLTLDADPGCYHSGSAPFSVTVTEILRADGVHKRYG